MFQRNPGAVLFVCVMMMFHFAVYAGAQSGVTKVVPQIAVGSFDNGGTVYEAAFFITNLHSAPNGDVK